MAELLVERPPAQQVERRLGERMRLGAPLLGVLPPRPRPSSERAHGERDREIDNEREPVRAVTQLERVRRRQEEPVEREHARHGDRGRERRPPDDRYGKHGEDVERPEAQNGHVRLERPDDQTHERDRSRARQDPDQ